MLRASRILLTVLLGMGRRLGFAIWSIAGFRRKAALPRNPRSAQLKTRAATSPDIPFEPFDSQLSSNFLQLAIRRERKPCASVSSRRGTLAGCSGSC